MTPCEHCGRDTPDVAFCTWCGAHRGSSGDAAKARRHDYAAHAGEHVAQPSVVTTLFPHLPRHRAHEFRWGLIGGLAVVVALVGGGLVVAAILAAAVLVPALYLVYLYEAQVYRDEPAKVLGLTMVAGVVLGVVVSLVAKALLHSSPLKPTQGIGYLVGATIVLPLVQEVVKPVPVFGLRGSGKFTETIDGLTFGVAAGLGYAAAETIVNLSRVIATEPVHTASANWLSYVVTYTVLNPILQASCTGILVAALWKPRRLGKALYALAVPVALGGHVLYSAVGQLLQDHGVPETIEVFFYAAVIAGLLVYIRHLVHDALLDEATDFGFRAVVCPHCRHSVGAAAFCPLCGGAVSAGPRTAALVGAPMSAPTAPAAGPQAAPGSGTTPTGQANA